MSDAAIAFAPSPAHGAGPHFSRFGLVGRSRAIGEVVRRIDLVSASSSTVLITGETGTGKELVARAIHQRSARRAMPFVSVNCAAIPDTLLESNLFGHVRGAFTDATSTKRGRFSLADRGSIFLDEIGTMSGGLQAKLLRVLQEREVEPLGAERAERVDVRVIAATNRDLHQLVEEGRFQADLFYRLLVVPIVVPPLRERADDIPMLVDHFVEKHAARNHKPIAAIEDGVIATLQGYHWPGNVRQLEHTIERAVVLTTGTVIARDVVTIEARTPAAGAGALSLNLQQNVERVERDTIRRALEMSPLKRQAATLLGISPRALTYYLAKYPLIGRGDSSEIRKEH
ncbi:MAG TPA: sigma 54-interacting transcriptional regulator [Vicinamibacterales bacterium]|nr:sigma 54-interacting transcriptional regulator [Vicinamibacterales bacterium]